MDRQKLYIKWDNEMNEALMSGDDQKYEVLLKRYHNFIRPLLNSTPQWQ